MFKLRSSNAWVRNKLILLTPLFRARKNRAKMAATTTRKTGRPRTCGCTCCRGTRTSRPASPGPTTRSTSEAECPTPIRAITITTPRTARHRRRRRRRRWTSPGSTATPDSWRLRSTERFIFCFHVPAIQWKLIKVGMSHRVFLESGLIYRCTKFFCDRMNTKVPRQLPDSRAERLRWLIAESSNIQGTQHSACLHSNLRAGAL